MCAFPISMENNRNFYLLRAKQCNAAQPALPLHAERHCSHFWNIYRSTLISAVPYHSRWHLAFSHFPIFTSDIWRHLLAMSSLALLTSASALSAFHECTAQRMRCFTTASHHRPPATRRQQTPRVRHKLLQIVMNVVWWVVVYCAGIGFVDAHWRFISPRPTRKSFNFAKLKMEICATTNAADGTAVSKLYTPVADVARTRT